MELSAQSLPFFPQTLKVSGELYGIYAGSDDKNVSKPPSDSPSVNDEWLPVEEAEKGCQIKKTLPPLLFPVGDEVDISRCLALILCSLGCSQVLAAGNSNIFSAEIVALA